MKEGDEILQEKRNCRLRTLYLKENRLVGYQLVGDICAAGILRGLMLQGADPHPLRHRLLVPDFGEGIMVWQALAAFA